MTRPSALFAGTLLVAAACGGGSSSPGPRTLDEGDSETEAPSAAREDADQEEDSAPAPALSRCDDGTCFTCGQGICPKGFYCDEQAVGGAACAWLPSCPTQAACSCVKQTLGSGCACEEREGGVFVSCK